MRIARDASVFVTCSFWRWLAFARCRHQVIQSCALLERVHINLPVEVQLNPTGSSSLSS